MLKAQVVGAIGNRRVYRVPVLVRCNDSQACATVAETRFTVLAYSPRDAANWVRDQLNRPETEIFAYGPQGGETYRYIGWESAIGMALSASWGRCYTQLRLPLS